jgi:hypothetical protein|tara:strand:- start:40 stop:291 length:252 start_codon:yes stop_codon:yes gene_type:complete
MMFFNLCGSMRNQKDRESLRSFMVDAADDDNRSDNRKLDSIRRERESIKRLLQQAKMSNLVEEVKKLNQEFDRLGAFLSGELD